MSTARTIGPVVKPPGKLSQIAVFILLLPVYIPALALVAIWTLARGKRFQF